MQHKIITTVDGSHTIFVPELNEHYHSTNGAIQESNHVFIEAGFRYCLRKHLYQVAEFKNQSDQMIHNNKGEKKVLIYSQPDNQKHPQQEINILEIGFGTGLNGFLTLLESEKWPVNVFYHSVELYPIAVEEAQKLNYSELVHQAESLKQSGADQESEITKHSNVNNTLFLKLHSTPWEKAIEITPKFTLLKQNLDFSNPEEFRSDRLFNLVYFDAFAPDKQPDMWSQDIFNKIHYLCDKNAVFITYCAKGAVRRMLQSAGFIMERLPGPPGKREILRGENN
jgi:tRNA U34 5-methylaminomethyl-2-thiouridine-forming methyltransferase MnmC